MLHGAIRLAVGPTELRRLEGWRHAILQRSMCAGCPESWLLSGAMRMAVSTVEGLKACRLEV